MKQKAKICCNCVHGGTQFKLGGLTHLHCERIKYTEKELMSGKISPYNSLKEWYDKCEHFEPKEQENKKHTCFEASHVECTCKDKCLRNIKNY